MNQVAERLAPRVRRLCRAIVKNGALAEDASQLALVEILESARTYGGKSSVERWADRITARVTLRHAKDERRRFRIVTSIEDTDTVEPSSPAHDFADSTRAATPRHLEEYLGSLSDVQREALLMKHSLGYTVEEIAELLSVPVGTVKDRLVAARRQMRKLIQRDLTIVGGRKQS
jgi:RNA polymerase sigma-70 factor (ECF subfamily)